MCVWLETQQHSGRRPVEMKHRVDSTFVHRRLGVGVLVSPHGPELNGAQHQRVRICIFHLGAAAVLSSRVRH